MGGDESGRGVREARVLAGMGESYYWLAEYADAIDVLERAVNLGTEHDDPWTLALAFRFLGDIAINVWADVDRAEILLDRSLVEAERLGEPHAIAALLFAAGAVDTEPAPRSRVHLAPGALDRERHDDR